MISVNNLSVEFSSQLLFDNINYVINPKDKIALVGKNGAGKSTMLKIIAGLQKPTGGSVAVPADVTIGYLPQQMVLTDTLTVVEEVRKVFAHVREMHDRLDGMSAELAERTDYDSEDYHKLIEQVTLLTEQLAMAESDNYEADMERTLLGLGFVRSDFNRPTSEFSGGWRMRIELAKILLQRPDVLLLDEPTNHLDIESIQWLESFLMTKAKAVVLVSHDRAFIDNVTNRTIEISCGKIYDYAVNYSKFVALRAERLEQQMRAYRNQQKQIADTEEFIERFRYKATKAVQVQSRMKQLAKIERIEVDEVDTSHLNLRFPPAPRSGDFPLILEDVGKAYGEHQVFDHATFTLRRGEKVAFVGKNGEGKSTLVKCIMGEIPFTGSLRIGHNFAQNQAQLLDGEVTVFDTIDRVAVGDIRLKIRDILGAFMFGGEASDKKVKVLSGGEKTRLAYEFGGGQVRECLGGIYEFLEKKKMASLRELELPAQKPKEEKSAPQKAVQQAETTANEVSAKPRLSYAEQKERDRELKRAARKIEEAEAAVGQREAELADVEARIAAGDVSPEIFTAHAEATKAVENAMSVWELAGQDLDEFKARYGVE